MAADRLLEVYLLDTAVGDALARLPWIADGIAGLESSYTERLRQLADVQQEWRLESLALDALFDLAETDTEIVRMLVAYPWLRNGVTEVEQQVIQSFASVDDGEGVAFVRSMAGLSWIRDGLTSVEQRAIGALFVLRAADAAVAQQVKDLPWVADGITDAEQQAIGTFAWAAHAGDGAFARFVAGLPWVRDSVVPTEQRTIQELFSLNARDPATARWLMTLSWVADGPVEVEPQEIDSFAVAADADNGPFARIAAGLQWVRDGVNGVEAAALIRLHRLAAIDAATAQMVADLPWLADGVTFYESLHHLDPLIAVTKADLAIAREVIAFPGVADGIDHADQETIQLLAQLAQIDRETARVVLAFPWLADGVTRVELQSVHVAAQLVVVDAELVATLPWLADDVTAAELTELQRLLSLARSDPTIAQLAAILPWLVDDMDLAESQVVQLLVRLAKTDREIMQHVVAFPWVIDGISDGEPWTMYVVVEFVEAGWALPQLEDALAWVVDDSIAEEQATQLLARLANTNPHAAQPALPWARDGTTSVERWAVYGLSRLAEQDISLAQQVASLPWMHNDVSNVEQMTVLYLHQLTKTNPALARQIAALPWMADDITGDERWTLSGLTRLARRAPALAQRVADFAWVGDGITDRESGALRALGSAGPGRAGAVLDRIGDDSSEEAIWLLYVLFRLRHAGGGLLFDDMLRFHYTQSETVSLPLAGEVNLWAFQTAPSPRGEDLTAIVEETVRAVEAFMGTPFPVTDVVVVVPVIGGGTDHGIGGAHWGWFITVTRHPPDPVDRRVIYHEVGHYYFGFGPPWLVEGGAEFVSDYLRARTTGGEYPTDLSFLAERRVERHCLDRNISTINELNQRQIEDPGYETICHYSFGSYFLLHLYETLGEEALSAALRELYLQYQGEPRPVTEEEFAQYEEAIYHAFLRHTPPQLVAAFHEVYDRIHGGPRPD